MGDAKASLRPTFEQHRKADGIDRAVLIDDEGKVQRVLPDKPHRSSGSRRQENAG